ncbi:hypothetical protein FF098_010285 [Parvularcula flava]|uniref:Uncharacterized protein n=1 Tax=Aquisalinus luteolus TaxID=1566827 RepID=A0ABX0HJV9_9PROT|nr:hypothetical protein [Aquisalinus luteolus]NHK28293.1 hypothetical protein [Aquisalinus luteolus]
MKLRTRLINSVFLAIFAMGILTAIISPVVVDQHTADLIKLFVDVIASGSFFGLAITAACVLNARETASPNNVARQVFYFFCFGMPYVGAFAIRPKILLLLENPE